MKALMSHVEQDHLHGTKLTSSTDIEVNMTYGGQSSVTHGPDAFRQFVIDSLDVVHMSATSNRVYVSSVRTLQQRKETASILLKLITDSQYYHGHSRGSNVPEQMLPALFTALSEIGLSFGNSKYKRFLSSVMSTHGINAGRFRCLIDMDAPSVHAVAQVLYVGEVEDLLHDQDHFAETVFFIFFLFRKITNIYVTFF
jgi:hypothetical protein